MAWEQGAWFGSISCEEQAMGGAWVIGDKPHCSEPDFPGIVDIAQGPLVKIWFTYPDRYGENAYQFKNRLESGLTEYVRVLIGRLDCLTHDEVRALTFPLEYPSEGVNLAAHITRCWCLPTSFSHASGVRLCRREQNYFPAFGLGYELGFWDTGSRTSLLTLSEPINRTVWNYQFIAPFLGSCFLSPGLCSPNRPVLPGEYVFLRRQEREQWHVQTSMQARGVVIYF